jgi:dipeptidase E
MARKLFLSSHAISDDQISSFTSLVGKELPSISFALCENAADPYPEDRKGFVYATRDTLSTLGMRLTLVNLKDYIGTPSSLASFLSNFDVMWFGGGNVFYLRWLMREAGFDHIAQQLVDSGVVYGGGSAGEIVAGPSLRHFDIVDDPRMSPDRIEEGLGLTALTIIPHWGVERYQAGLNEIKTLYENDGCTPITIRDGQAVVCDGDQWSVNPP